MARLSGQQSSGHNGGQGGHSGWVVRLHASFQDPDCVYLVMPLAHGGTLQQLIARRRHEQEAAVRSRPPGLDDTPPGDGTPARPCSVVGGARVPFFLGLNHLLTFFQS